MMIFDNKIILLFYFIISYEYWVYCFVENGMCLNERNDPEYFLLSPCHKSTLKSIIEVNVNSLEKCKRIAIRKRGMGINYSPKNLRPDKIKHHSFKTCIIVSCPETENSTSLVYDSRYHYYSMYAFPIPPANSSCIEGVGVYVINFMKQNYASGKQLCKEYGGDLADIATERKTIGISQLLTWTLSKSDGPMLAYIGMDDIKNEGIFIRSNDYLLSCTTFRAWAPGQPKEKYPEDNCCAIDSKKMWHVVNCKRNLPFVCEIFPWGEYDFFDFAEPDFCIEDVFIN